MSNYPTPPPTSSPKNSAYRPFSPKVAAQDSYYKDTYSKPASPVQQPWDATYKPSQGQTVITVQPQDPSASRPEYQYVTPHPQSEKPTPSEYQDTIPPRRRPSPTSTSRTSPPPLRRQSPRPFFYSPTNPTPTPYNASRPQPRPGFLRRILNKIKKWLRIVVKWCRRNPIKAGLLTFVPLLAGVAAVKVASGVAHGVAYVGKGLIEGMGGKIEKKKGKLEAKVKKAEEEAKKEFGYGMDEFVGFGGSKGGPVEGIMKVLQIGANHWSKLSPSAVPRLAALLLEIYFLEKYSK